MHGFWFYTMTLIIVACLGPGVAQTLPVSHMLRFADTPYLQQAASESHAAFHLLSPAPDIDAPQAEAYDWLRRAGWKQVWPLGPLPDGGRLTFDGPSQQRYLRLSTDDTYYIWTRRFKMDPHQAPFLEITWGVERFPQQAALDIYGRNDRPLSVMIFFGLKVPSPGLRPNVPRALVFFWGETEKLGSTYTCVKSRQGRTDKRLQCKYPHVRYIALRRGGVGTVHTDRVNLLEHFQQQFPEYWQEHQRVPPVVAVSFEAGSNKTESSSSARLYALVFSASASSNGHVPSSPQEGR